MSHLINVGGADGGGNSDGNVAAHCEDNNKDDGNEFGDADGYGGDHGDKDGGGADSAGGDGGDGDAGEGDNGNSPPFICLLYRTIGRIKYGHKYEGPCEFINCRGQCEYYFAAWLDWEVGGSPVGHKILCLLFLWWTLVNCPGTSSSGTFRPFPTSPWC